MCDSEIQKNQRSSSADDASSCLHTKESSNKEESGLTQKGFQTAAGMESNEDLKNFVWDTETFTKLLYAMAGHKPVGVNKHLEMACILEKFQFLMKKPIPAKVVWDRLDEMYNMENLDAIEGATFPNEQVDFSLPDNVSSVKEYESKVSLGKEDDTTKEETQVTAPVKKEADTPSSVVSHRVSGREMKVKDDKGKVDQSKEKKDERVSVGRGRPSKAKIEENRKRKNSSD